MSRPIVILASLAALGTLAGCGASDTLNPDVVARAADKTASAGGAKLAMTVEAAGQHINVNGFLDTKNRKGRMTFSLPQLQGSVDMVFVQRIFYMHFPAALTNKLPGGKPWLKFDIDRIAKTKGIDLGALQDPSTNDPSQTLDQLRGAGDVKRVGTDTIRGTPTTHYKATVDLRKAADKAPAARRAAAQRSIDQVIKLTGTSTLPIEVWLDKQGRMRRMNLTMQVKGHALNESMDLYDFGTREAIKAPPASETTDVTQLAAKQAQTG